MKPRTSGVGSESFLCFVRDWCDCCDMSVSFLFMAPLKCIVVCAGGVGVGVIDVSACGGVVGVVVGVCEGLFDAVVGICEGVFDAVVGVCEDVFESVADVCEGVFVAVVEVCVDVFVSVSGSVKMSAPMFNDFLVKVGLYLGVMILMNCVRSSALTFVEVPFSTFTGAG